MSNLCETKPMSLYHLIVIKVTEAIHPSTVRHAALTFMLQMPKKVLDGFYLKRFGTAEEGQLGHKDILVLVQRDQLVTKPHIMHCK